MLGEGALVKLMIPAGLFITAELLPKVVQAGLGAVALTAGGLAGLGFLVRLIHRSWRHGKAFIARAQTTMDIVESTPENFAQVNASVGEVHERLDRHRAELIKHGDELRKYRKSLDVMADADEHRVKDAVAGDDRTPLDRRQFPPAA